MTSKRPYLIRALYEWILDNQMTPHLLVNAEGEDVVVPVEYVQEGKIILNISPNAVNQMIIGNDVVRFSARFSGNSMSIFIPISNVMAIYAKENGVGMFFPDEETDNEEDVSDQEKKTKPPHLRIIK